MGGKLLDALSKLDWTMLILIVIGFLALLYQERSKSEKLNQKIEKLKNGIFDNDTSLIKKLLGKHENLGSEISDRHIGLGSEISGKYKNLGEKISSEHMSIKKDTKSIWDELETEKMARQALYHNSIHAKEILDTMDIMKEVIIQNAQLNVEITSLKVKNQELSSVNTSDKLQYLSNDIRRFEKKLSEFETFTETEEIRAVLKKILTELSEYDN